MNMMRSIRGSSFLCGLTLCAAAAMTPAVADQITLQSLDGAVNVTGDFIGMENNAFLIRTELGDLTISAERVRCTGNDCPNAEKREADVSLAGSETIGVGVMPLLLDGFAAQLDAEAKVEELDTASAFNGTEIVADLIGEGGFGEELNSYRVYSTNSVQAFRGLLEGSAEIGMSSRRINAKEAATLEAAGAGVMTNPAQEHIVAIDSLIIVTHPSNPVKSISMDDLADVFMGKIKNWAELGGQNRPIKVVARQSDAGTRAIFADRVFGGPNLVVGNARIALNSTEMADFVSDHEGAIGYTGYAFQRGTQALDVVNECGLITKPDSFSVRTEEYALQRRLYLYNRADMDSEPAKEFLDYVLSPKADGLITKAGFIDHSVARRTQDNDSERATQLLKAQVRSNERGLLQQMQAEIGNYDRLSTTFRFRTGSAQLDERALVDMQRLASFLQEQPAGTKVKIVGFTDSVGSFENNRRLAGGRAEQVKRTLASVAGNSIADLDVQTAAYGELAPTACNVSDGGRAINRRVEVWIEPSNVGS